MSTFLMTWEGWLLGRDFAGEELLSVLPDVFSVRPLFPDTVYDQRPEDWISSWAFTAVLCSESSASWNHYIHWWCKGMVAPQLYRWETEAHKTESQFIPLHWATPSHMGRSWLIWACTTPDIQESTSFSHKHPLTAQMALIHQHFGDGWRDVAELPHSHHKTGQRE